ncbi:DUF1996 domain-containing protein [Veronia pacifica]|nr:DUF1996 domain-containing protein [Veronia pacifica]
MLLVTSATTLISCQSGANIGTSDVGRNLKPGLQLSSEDYGEREDGSGAFRTHCLESHQSNDDPLVYPDQPNATHSHVFFGNPSVDAFTKAKSLRQATKTTCDGNTLNRSAYWVPALYGADGRRIPYIEPLFYYKTGYHLPASSIQTPPEDLRMIAGQAMPNVLQSTQAVKFRCASWTSNQSWFDDGDPLDHIAHIPDCKKGDLVEMRIVFPQCWDGKNLDSDDHQSHMAYPSEATPPMTGTGACPASHPIAIPEISYNFAIYVTDETGPSTAWRLSSDMNAKLPAGHSAHADWMNGWDNDIMRAIVENCLNPAFECSVGLLGDGTRLVSVIEE